MTGGEMLLQLKAKGNADQRYSDNLMKWLKKYKNWPVYTSFSHHSYIDGSEVGYDRKLTQPHQIIICIGESDGFATGSRLSEILGKGASADRYAFSERQFKIEPLPSWFDDYLYSGKCFIDPEHRLYVGDERWETGKKTRTCRWCGHIQEKITKRKTYHIWR